MSGAAPLAHVVRFAVWWVVLFGLWWALVGEWSLSDLWWGIVLSALAATAGTLVSQAHLVHADSAGAALRVAPSVAWAVLVDFCVVMAVLGRAVVAGSREATGAFLRRDVAHEDAQSPSRRGFLTVAATFSPNAYVIDIDPETDEALLHDLRPMRFSERPL